MCGSWWLCLGVDQTDGQVLGDAVASASVCSGDHQRWSLLHSPGPRQAENTLIQLRLWVCPFLSHLSLPPSLPLPPTAFALSSPIPLSLPPCSIFSPSLPSLSLPPSVTQSISTQLSTRTMSTTQDSSNGCWTLWSVQRRLGRRQVRTLNDSVLKKLTLSYRS